MYDTAPELLSIVERDTALIAEMKCPLCMHKCGTQRAALQMHLRRRNDGPHALWKRTYWKTHFKVGNTKRLPPAARDVNDVIDAVRTVFGDRLLSALTERIVTTQ
jgi:hypothetical protein